MVSNKTDLPIHSTNNKLEHEHFIQQKYIFLNIFYDRNNKQVRCLFMEVNHASGG
jgi:hypothetical protein